MILFRRSSNPDPVTSIDRNDKEGFREVLQGIDSENIDVLLHSPGGQSEAAEAIVKLLRAKMRLVSD